MSEATQHEFGRVDENCVVYVKESDGERQVGSFPDGTPAEALAYFVHKFEDLEAQVKLLESRIASGTAGGNAESAAAKLVEQLVSPAAVGDLASLRERAAKVAEKATEIAQQQKEERAKAREESLERREAIVAEAERLAATPVEQIHWRRTGEAFQELFEKWQAEQRGRVNIPKSKSDALWKRFRTARNHFESARRSHFQQQDAHNREVKQVKERLISRAEELADKGAAGVPAYRALLDEWKQAPRAGRKLEDALWARFRAAGDVLYQARAEEVVQVNEEYAANLTAKEALLGEYASIAEATDHEAAREQLTTLQEKWDEVGRVPREKVREVEDKLRALVAHVEELEAEHWRKTDPETKARSEGLRGQLEESISQLEQEIAAAEAAGDSAAKAAAEEKLATQKSWLAALGSFDS